MYCSGCPEDNVLQLKDKPDPQCRRMLGAMIIVTMWVSSQKCPPQITCPLIQPQCIGLSAAITQRAPATWPRVPPPCPKNLAKANQGTSCTWAPLSLHEDQRQTNWGGWPASIPLALLPPTPALLGLQWDPCVIAGQPTRAPRFPCSQPCRGWGFKWQRYIYISATRGPQRLC